MLVLNNGGSWFKEATIMEYVHAPLMLTLGHGSFGSQVHGS